MCHIDIIDSELQSRGLIFHPAYSHWLKGLILYARALTEVLLTPLFLPC